MRCGLWCFCRVLDGAVLFTEKKVDRRPFLGREGQYFRGSSRWVAQNTRLRASRRSPWGVFRVKVG